MQFHNMAHIDFDLLKQAHGEDVITPAEKAALQEQSKKATWRLRWFNTPKGWRLRRLCRGHALKRNHISEHCGLCGGNRAGAVRTKTIAYCEDCDIPLCPIPPKEGFTHSCHYIWHNVDVLEPRIIWKPNANPKKKRKRRRKNNIDDDDDDIDEEEEDEEEEMEWEEAEEDGEDEDENEEEEGQVARLVYSWKRDRTLFQMLVNLPEVLPTGTPWQVNQSSNAPTQIHSLMKRARLKIHPDKVPAEHRDIANQVTAALNAAYDEYKEMGGK